MDIVSQLQQGIAEGLKSLYGHEVSASDLGLQPTRKEFEGTYTFVTFLMEKFQKRILWKPERIWELI